MPNIAKKGAPARPVVGDFEILSPRPSFTIVTPSFNMLSYLKLCHRSIADQEVDCEHVVIDGGSADGTADWLDRHPNIISISEPDDGMYDAVNKGFALAKGEILAYLNCDEQYLPGALKSSWRLFLVTPRSRRCFR